MKFFAVIILWCCRLAIVPMFVRFRCGNAAAAFVTKSNTRSSLADFLVRDYQRTPHRSFVGVLASAIDRSNRNPALDITNQDLVQRRLQVENAKREARQNSIRQKIERNLQLKRLLSTQASSSSDPALYAIKVTVSDELRTELQLNGREKRGRVFVEVGSDAVKSIRALRQELHSFFRALRKNTYVLSASFPIVSENGTVSIPENATTVTWPIVTDDDVIETFAKADVHYRDHASMLNRPTIVIHVHRDPDAPPPPPPPSYLKDMADPQQSPTMTMLSFYAFPPGRIDDTDNFAMMLRKLWKPFAALGRVYVAYEGINAQMSVPTNVLQNFQQCCASIPELGQYMENGINVDPIALTREEFATAGGGSPDNPQPPFRNLHIRVRRQVVADGLDKSYDWQAAGYDMPPLEWHNKIKTAKEKREKGCNDGLPIILDCRNAYETDIGSFEGAEPLNTESFRESWKVLEERLADVPKDADIMTFCTGGIRCVKVGAYLTQELGFTNVKRLAAGIIGYDRTLKQSAPQEDSMFKGTNFVFDGRLGRPITEDALGTCLTCGAETSLICNCRNENCHKRIIQCETCRTSFHGTCSDACRQRLLNGAMTPVRLSSPSQKHPLTQEEIDQPPRTLEDYCTACSSPLPSVYNELRHNTKALIPSGSHMISDGAQGRLLTQFASLTREGRVLELGTFTAYATACLLEGAMNSARATESVGGSRISGPYVMTMERDDKAYSVAVNHLRVLSAHGFTEEAAQRLAHLRQSTDSAISPIDDSCVSLNCAGTVTCDVVHVSDALAAIEEMAAGRGDLQAAPFDLVYVDADKTRLIDYVDVFLSSSRLLKTGGFLIVDNVLYKGLVLEAAGVGAFPSLADPDNANESELRRNRRARRLANKMHRFNKVIACDDRAEVLVLPLRDGLSVIRKK